MIAMPIILLVALTTVALSPLFGGHASKWWWATYLLGGVPLSAFFLASAWVGLWIRAERAVFAQRVVSIGEECLGTNYIITSITVFLAATVFNALTIIKWRAEKENVWSIRKRVTVTTTVISGVLCNAIWHAIMIIECWR